MENKAKFNFEEIYSVFSNADIYNVTHNWQSVGVSTDTRSLHPHNIFVALKGENYDAHNLIKDCVVDTEIAAVVVSKLWLAENDIRDFNIGIIAVADTLVALGELATFHRSRFSYPVLAVAGSNGKTTTKELIASVLSEKYKVLKTNKNFNNSIGVAHTLLAMDDCYTAAVVEIGTNHPGEIATLTNMLRPTDGIITNIGKEHLEYFGDLDDVEIEETYLYGYLLKKGGNVFINTDDERLVKYAKVLPDGLLYGSTDASDFQVSIEFSPNLNPIIDFKITTLECKKKYTARMNGVGYAMALNAVAAAAVGYGFGLTGEQIVAGLEKYESVSDGYGRMVVESLDNITILNDCYNANPNSMIMSLKTLSMMSVDCKIAVLGDMFELGESALEEHKNIILFASDLAGNIFLIGENMEFAVTQLPNVSHKIIMGNSFADIARNIKNIAVDRENVVVLVKGSRGMRLENFITELKNIMKK